MNKQTIDLDVITGGVPQVLHVAQYDTGARTLKFNIYSSNNDLDLTGATAKISGRKADGLGFEYPATISDGVVVADCTDQMTAVAGIVECAITLTNSEGQIQTARFDLNVKPAPLNDDTVISDSDFPLIEQAIEAEGKAEEAEAWAVGTRDGDPVPVSDPTYENNAKYWAEQAEQTDIGQVNEEIADIWKANGVLGAKNLIFNQQAGRSGTSNGITYTFNYDGSVSLDGTASKNTYIYLWDTSIWANEKFKAGSYKASASLNKSSETKVYFGADKRTASSYIAQYFKIGVNSTVPVEKEFNSDGDYYISYWVRIESGNTVDNVKIYPMLRYAYDTDTTYQPYAMTNRELTEDIKAIECDKTTAGTYTLQCVVDSSGNKTYSWV